MATNKSKKVTEDIDENFLLHSIKEQAKPQEKSDTTEVPKAEPKIENIAPETEAEPETENFVPETETETELVQELPEQPQPKEVKEVKEVKEIEPKEVKEVKEQPVKRKRNQVDYSSLFLQKNELKERSCVYISRRIHSTISEIVRVIANRDVTVGGYIDSVLLQHLETHRDEINNLYKQDRKDLIP